MDPLPRMAIATERSSPTFGTAAKSASLGRPDATSGGSSCPFRATTVPLAAANGGQSRYPTDTLRPRRNGHWAAGLPRTPRSASQPEIRLGPPEKREVTGSTPVPTTSRCAAQRAFLPRSTVTKRLAGVLHRARIPRTTPTVDRSGRRRGRPAGHRVQSVRHRLCEAGKQVAVPVEGQRRRGVPQASAEGPSRLRRRRWPARRTPTTRRPA